MCLLWHREREKLGRLERERASCLYIKEMRVPFLRAEYGNSQSDQKIKTLLI